MFRQKALEMIRCYSVSAVVGLGRSELRERVKIMAKLNAASAAYDARLPRLLTLSTMVELTRPRCCVTCLGALNARPASASDALRHFGRCPTLPQRWVKAR